MNAVEIEEAVSKLAESPFDAETFPYAFLEAFGNKQTTIQRLRSGSSNKSDIPGGVLQNNNIHIVVAESGKVSEMLSKLRDSSATTRQKAKFILSTDGTEFQAEDLTTDDPPVVCNYADFHNHFGFFLPLAGISTIKQIRESSFDIKATGRLNRLYVELLKDNPDWGKAERRHDMNHFVARLIFCFFAEDTGIFNSRGIFSKTVEQMSERDSSNTHEVISEIFRAMNTDYNARVKANLTRWVGDFPYVNGGLFSGSTEVPRFSKIARSYLLHIGNLEWMRINTDIFGSMIQAVAEDDERGALGMHYTSVPNILRVLNPLFLDDLRSQFEKAGDNSRALLNLRKRISKIRVFDPACGSGNFLVIAYKEMRAIEAEINKKRGESEIYSEIRLTNFRGIELRDFPAEIARLALIIAEYQCNVLYIGQIEAIKEFLPLDAENWITCGNALQTDWTKVCPIENSNFIINEGDLFQTPLSQPHFDFEKDSWETYICGNPPYLGSSMQDGNQKSDLESIFSNKLENWKNLDYISGWFSKAADFISITSGDFAFVSTNSVCQGQQVPLLWPKILDKGIRIFFAYTSFKWANLASHNAGVIVVIVGCTARKVSSATIYTTEPSGEISSRQVNNINQYLVAGRNVIIEPQNKITDGRSIMLKGNMPTDGGNLVMEDDEMKLLSSSSPDAGHYIRRYFGSQEFIRGESRWCLWIDDAEAKNAAQIPAIKNRLDAVRKFRETSKASTTRPYANFPHKFRQIQDVAQVYSIIVPSVSSERREYLPVGLLPNRSIVSNLAFALYDAPIWTIAIIASRLHLVWVAIVCGKLKTDFRYSNTLGWNAFPLPNLTEKNLSDLKGCAEDILLAREAHFPATIADLYEPDSMPKDLRSAHYRNDEILERIYIGRRFKNDTERLEKLFELYTKKVAATADTSQLKRNTKKKGNQT